MESFRCLSCLKNLIFGRKYSKHDEKQENIAQNNGEDKNNEINEEDKNNEINEEDKKIDSSAIVVNDPPKTKENNKLITSKDKKVNNIKDSKWEIIDKTKKIEI